MSEPYAHPTLTAGVLGLVDAERDVTLAINGPGGWPMAYAATYVNEGLDLYLLISGHARIEALRADPRVGVAIHHRIGRYGDVVSVSMRGRMTDVADALKRDAMRVWGLETPEDLTARLMVFRPEEVVAHVVSRGRSREEPLVIRPDARVPLTRPRRR